MKSTAPRVTHRVAVIGGDGIGPEVIAEALKFEPQLSLRLCSDYDDLRVMRNEIEYSTSDLQYADHRHVNLSIEIGDHLLAIAKSINS